VIKKGTSFTLKAIFFILLHFTLKL